MTITTKFNKGEKVWFMHNNKPLEIIIVFIDISIGGASGTVINYAGTKTNTSSYHRIDTINEHKLFKTKEDLIKSL